MSATFYLCAYYRNQLTRIPKTVADLNDIHSAGLTFDLGHLSLEPDEEIGMWIEGPVAFGGNSFISGQRVSDDMHTYVFDAGVDPDSVTSPPPETAPTLQFASGGGLQLDTATPYVVGAYNYTAAMWVDTVLGGGATTGGTLQTPRRVLDPQRLSGFADATEGQVLTKSAGKLKWTDLPQSPVTPISTGPSAGRPSGITEPWVYLDTDLRKTIYFWPDDGTWRFADGTPA